MEGYFRVRLRPPPRAVRRRNSFTSCDSRVDMCKKGDYEKDSHSLVGSTIFFTIIRAVSDLQNNHFESYLTVMFLKSKKNELIILHCKTSFYQTIITSVVSYYIACQAVNQYEAYP